MAARRKETGTKAVPTVQAGGKVNPRIKARFDRLTKERTGAKPGESMERLMRFWLEVDEETQGLLLCRVNKTPHAESVARSILRSVQPNDPGLELTTEPMPPEGKISGPEIDSQDTGDHDTVLSSDEPSGQ